MIHPRNDYILIERFKSVAQSGLIVIPDTAQEKSMLGKVLAVGPGKLVEGVNGGMVRRPVEARPGEVWYFNSKWSDLSGSHYVDAQIEDRNLHLIMEGDLLLRVNNGKTSSAAIDGRRIAASSHSGNGEAHQRRQAAKANRDGRQA